MLSLCLQTIRSSVLLVPVVSFFLLVPAAAEDHLATDGDLCPHETLFKGMRHTDCLELLRSPKIQSELGVDGKQGDLLEDVFASYEDALREVLLPRRDRRVSSEERRAARSAWRQRREEVAGEFDRLAIDLFTKLQRRRLAQIGLQLRGIAVLGDPDVAVRLALTVTQSERIRVLLREGYRLRRRVLKRAAEEGSGVHLERLQTQHARLETSILDVLTEKQRQTFAKLQGKPFDVDGLYVHKSGGSEIRTTRRFPGDARRR